MTKNLLLNWYSSIKKKIEKDSDNFWHQKLTLKVKRLGDFALFDTSPLLQFSKFNNFLWVCWFFLILYPRFENSTTRIVILSKVYVSKDWWHRLQHCFCFPSWNESKPRHSVTFCKKVLDKILYQISSINEWIP